MSLLLWILVGLVGGWIAGKSFDGDGFGRAMDLVPATEPRPVRSRANHRNSSSREF